MRLLLPALLLLAASPQDDRDRSPHDLALSPDGRWALVAEADAGGVALVDLDAGRVAARVETGRRPFALAWAGPRAVVTHLLDDDVAVLDVDPPKLSVAARIPVGDEPRGVALLGDRAAVACSGDDALAIVDLAGRRVVERLPAGDEPWHVVYEPRGKRLAVSCALSQDVRVFQADPLKPLYSVALRGHNARRLALAPGGDWAYVPSIAERGRPTSKDNIDRGWVVASRLSRVPLKEEGPREAISLDPRSRAVGDVDGVAVSPDGATIALAAGGTHELILLRTPLPFVAYGGPGDHIDADLLKDTKRFRRVPLGDRPVAVAFHPDGDRVVVANHLANSLQVVSSAAGALVKTIALGGPAEPSLARRGEAIFYDATRSFHQWYSCHTCHVDGHTNGSTFDTENDGRYGNPKKTLSLRGVATSGPWTWHGWQTDLRTALIHSLKTTMQGPEPKDADVDALLAFVKTLSHVPPAGPKDEAAKRGEALFKNRACDACHVEPDYTSDETFLVGLEAPDDVHKGFNPPGLRGVVKRGPWLHDGRARTLEDLFQKHHRPFKLNEKPDFSPEELKDLIAFLNSL
jgi:DNA-binding beta-propeller fold protein YncE